MWPGDEARFVHHLDKSAYPFHLPAPFQDIVILRFDGEDEDTEAYLAMVNYLVGKHRCGVIKSGYHGIKDMYLLPLQRHTPVPPQLLPFDGPGQLHAMVM